MTNPTISVVLTTHEGYEKYLERAIESVLNQSYKDFELIVVKDGGTKSKIAAEYEKKDARVRYLHQKENFGQHPRPKNIGTLAAKGEYIAYLDADNLYRKDHLAALHREIVKTGVDVVYGDRMIVEEKTGKKVPGVKSEFNLGLLSKQNYIDTSDVLCKKSAIDAVGGWDESLMYFADWNLWVRMAKNLASFKHLPLTITDYTYHGENNVLKARDGINFDVQGCKLWPDKTSYGPRPKLKVAVYTMTMNRLRYTQETFISMREKTKYPFVHFVLDQGSTDKTWTWLMDNEKKMNLKCFTEGKNLGISAGSNYLVGKIVNYSKDWVCPPELPGASTIPPKPYDIIIKVDNDCDFLTDGWLEAVVDVYERTRGVVVSPYVEGLIDHPGGSPRVRDGYINDHYIGVVEHLGGIFSAAPAKAYETFRWKEDDFLHGFQDAIFSQEMKKQGLVLCYLENVRVEHLFPTSARWDETNDPEEDKEYRAKRKLEKATKYAS